MLFIILFLHQTTTMRLFFAFFVLLFIILFLHQTTTFGQGSFRYICCLSSCSYIKPQQGRRNVWQRNVVYHLVPTSNHNLANSNHFIKMLFIILFLHQTTTSRILFFGVRRLFIILFLHQTTTPIIGSTICRSCLSSCSYIKPQPNSSFPSFCNWLFIILFLHQTTTMNAL